MAWHFCSLYTLCLSTFIGFVIVSGGGVFLLLACLVANFWVGMLGESCVWRSISLGFGD